MKTWMIRLTNLLLIVILGWNVQSIAKEKTVTKEKVLSNGLKMIVREDHRAPVAICQVWYKVGSSDETRWVTGISHALEHMMFQGTPTLPKDAFAELISRFGGHNNAFTAEDFTAYYEELDAAHLAVALEAEADRMQNLTLPAEAFAKEIQVVMEERRMRTDDNPQMVTWERFMATAHPMGPYHHPIIGWKVDLETMTVDDLKQWYQNWYMPNNATLVVAGDVRAEEVFALAEKYFGAIPSRPLTKIGNQTEIAPLGEKRIQVHIPASLPYGMWGYAVPNLKSAQNSQECYALWVASAILDGGASARFTKELIRNQEIAAGIHAYYDPFKKYATQFMITGVPSKDHTIAELEQRLMVEIEKLKNEPVSEQELKRVKAQLLAKEVFEKDSISDQALVLGMLESVGLPWQLADELPEKIKAVSASQVQEVARKYFNSTALTVAELIPEKIHTK